MSFKKAVISTVAAAAIASTASANVARDNTGNYLVMPAYYSIANGNWKTDLRVVNSNTTHAVVAKVVIRSYEDSQELLDFPIYLSPGDVWTAELVAKGGNDVYLQTTDDSMIIGGEVVSEDNPVDKALFNNGPEEHGYVEVFVVGQKSAYDIHDEEGLDGSWMPGLPLDKMAIYDNWLEPGAGNPSDISWANLDGDAVYAQTVVSADGVGQEKAMTLMATALEGSFIPFDTQVNDVQLVQTDSTFDMYLGLVDVEEEVARMLAKTNIFVTYYNNNANETQLLLTQPVKHYYTEYNVTGFVEDQYDDAGTTWFQHIARDNMEHTLIPEPEPEDEFSGGEDPEPELTTTPCHNELCDIMVTDHMDGFESGYVDFILYGEDQNNTNSTVHFLTTIPTVITGVKVGDRAALNMYKPAYRKDSNIIHSNPNW